MDILKSKIRDIKYGANFKIVEPVNLYECTFGDNVFIGPFVEITKGVKLEIELGFQVTHLYVN